MSGSPITRLAGPLAIAAGAVILVAEAMLLSSFDATSRQATIANPVFGAGQVTLFVGFILLALAATALYGREADRAGRFGAFAYIAAMVGTMFLAGDLWFDTFAGPWIIANAPDLAANPNGTLVQGAFASYVLFAVGWMLFGLASMRARVYPIVLSATIVAGGLVGFYSLIPPYAVPLGGALLALGIWIVRHEHAPVEQGSQAASA
jgi:hypothetical protein